MKPERKLLLASIHDVGPGSERQVDQLATLIEKQLGSARFAMLVVPEHHGAHRLTPGSPFAARLRDWAESGVEMFVHGWYHRDQSQHEGLASFKAKHMTAGEGEFLGLDQAEAARRMRDGRALIEDITGREVAGFIAPAWLYGEGAKAALAECGFAMAEDHMRVWQPGSDRQLARGPVITWASRSTMRTASSLAFAALEWDGDDVPLGVLLCFLDRGRDFLALGVGIPRPASPVTDDHHRPEAEPPTTLDRRSRPEDPGGVRLELRRLFHQFSHAYPIRGLCRAQTLIVLRTAARPRVHLPRPP